MRDLDISTMAVAVDLLFEAGHIQTAREMQAIVLRLKNNQPCRTCAGAGVRMLAAWERAALHALGEVSHPLSTSDLMRRAWPGAQRSAACNRLAAMERSKLVTSSRSAANARDKMWTVRR